MRYSDIDTILTPWAVDRGLHIFTECKDEEVRVIQIVDDMGDTYQLYAGPDPKDPNYPDTSLALVGVSLTKRGDKKHHAMFRERQRFTFEQRVPPTEIAPALNTVWQRALEWILQAGHSRCTQ